MTTRQWTFLTVGVACLVIGGYLTAVGLLAIFGAQ